MQFIHQGTKYFPSDERNRSPLVDKLPVGTYVVKNGPFGLYFEVAEAFTLPGKLYGDVHQSAQRIMTSFLARPSGTGALLVGEKGSGKTMLAKLLSVQAAGMDIPTILVNEPYRGDGFNSLIQAIKQPCVIIFDEFEKVYPDSQNAEEPGETAQESILTLLDGIYSSQKLFVLTVNKPVLLNENLINRPGRLLYKLTYAGLSESFIQEYCEDVLDDKTEIPNILRATSYFRSFNFDMLKALVEEMNRYKEPAKVSLRYLNATPEAGFDATYDVAVEKEGVLLAPNSYEPNQWHGDPLDEDSYSPLQIYLKSAAEMEEGKKIRPSSPSERVIFRVGSADMTSGLPSKYVFSKRHQNVDYIVTITKVQSKTFNYLDSF